MDPVSATIWLLPNEWTHYLQIQCVKFGQIYGFILVSALRASHKCITEVKCVLGVD